MAPLKGATMAHLSDRIGTKEKILLSKLGCLTYQQRDGQNKLAVADAIIVHADEATEDCLVTTKAKIGEAAIALIKKIKDNQDAGGFVINARGNKVRITNDMWALVNFNGEGE